MSADVDGGTLEALTASARAGGRLALDTEFMGEGRYRTLLCLAQIATPPLGEEPGRVLVVDPLQEDLDASALADVLADPAIQVVVHAGRQDIALVRRRFATEVANVFDTQVAAGFAGLGAQSSYDSLLSEVLGVRLAKSASFTRWDTRPLSREQLSYAREDVVHLLELAGELERRLRALGREQWAREECEPLARSSDERDADAIFERLPRVGTLGAGARPVARQLVRWREGVAARQNRPVQSVLTDMALVELARRRPSTRAELERIRGVAALARGRLGEEVLEAVRRGRAAPAEPPPPRAQLAGTRPADAQLVALCEALVRARAADAGLAYELLASRADLQAIVAALRTGAEADVRTLRGWRGELAGTELLELLAGRRSLSVSDAGMGAHVQISDQR